MKGKIRLVSFDVWDTLLSINMFYKAIAEHLSSLVNRPQSDLERRFMKGYVELRKRRRFGDFDDSNIVQMTLEAMSKIVNVDPGNLRKATSRAVLDVSSRLYVIDGAMETLEMVKTYGLDVAIIGNVVFWSGDCNRKILEKTGLFRFIDAQVYADDVGVSKPKPEIFRQVLSEFQITPDEAVHVGDSLFEDFVGAVFSGMGAVLVDRSLNNPIKLSGWNAYIVPDLESLKQILTIRLPS